MGLISCNGPCLIRELFINNNLLLYSCFDRLHRVTRQYEICSYRFIPDLLIEVISFPHSSRFITLMRDSVCDDRPTELSVRVSERRNYGTWFSNFLINVSKGWIKRWYSLVYLTRPVTLYLLWDDTLKLFLIRKNCVPRLYRMWRPGQIKTEDFTTLSTWISSLRHCISFSVSTTGTVVTRWLR